MLVRLLYASRAAADTHAGAVTAIMQHSHAYNPKHGITGVLCHSDRAYLQVIEGGRDQVNRLYGKILRDTRHTDVVLLHYEEICERRYSGWTMGQTNLNKLNPGTLLRYSATAFVGLRCANPPYVYPWCASAAGQASGPAQHRCRSHQLIDQRQRAFTRQRMRVELRRRRVAQQLSLIHI